MKFGAKLGMSLLISVIIVALLWWPLGLLGAPDMGTGLILLIPILSTILFIGFSLSSQLDQAEELQKELKEKIDKLLQQDDSKND